MAIHVTLNSLQPSIIKDVQKSHVKCRFASELLLMVHIICTYDLHKIVRGVCLEPIIFVIKSILPVLTEHNAALRIDNICAHLQRNGWFWWCLLPTFCVCLYHSLPIHGGTGASLFNEPLKFPFYIVSWQWASASLHHKTITPYGSSS